MFNCATLFLTLSPLPHPVPFRLGDGEIVTSPHEGLVPIGNLIVQALYILAFRVCLLSVSCLDLSGLRAAFANQICTIYQVHNCRPILTGHLENGIYVLKIRLGTSSPQLNAPTAIKTTSTTPADLYYQHTFPIWISLLSPLYRGLLTLDLRLLSQPEECCNLHARLQRNDSIYQHPILIQVQSSTVRCDNGLGEYDNHLFRETLVDNDISFGPSPPYTQNMNGVAEGMIQTLNTRARSMMIDANIPVAFWAEMINTASYLQKRSPTIALQGRTPYEVLYRAIQGPTSGLNQPSLHHLRRIGCVAYHHTTDEKVQNKTAFKFGPRSTRCMLIGYKQDMKAMGHCKTARY